MAIAAIMLAATAFFVQAAPLGTVLHEPLPEGVGSTGRPEQPEAQAGQTAPRTDHTETAAGSEALPEAIVTAQGRIEKPKVEPHDATIPTYQAKPPPHVGLDRRTGADLDLHYQVVFDPTVAPFKREYAYDQVNPDLTLAKSGRGEQILATGQVARAGHELFWGHLRLKLNAEQKIALPSVAPTSQILSWQAIPEQPLVFYRDAAGNYSVSSPTEGEVDLRFLMDAPTTYFAAPLGQWQGGDDPEHPTLPTQLQARAQKLWPALGVAPGQARGPLLMRLVEYFRSYEPGEPPPQSADPLADLVLGKKGVCRHRTLAFVIICHSLGISAHYVMNDAHAFAEVWAPDPAGRGQWLRVDLGGGADSLELHAAKGKHLHQPQFGDPFPRPAAYTNQSGQVKIDGVTMPQSMAGAGKVKGAEDLSQGRQQGESGEEPGTLATGSFSQDPNAARRLWLQQRAQELAAPRLPPAVAKGQPPNPQLRTASTLALEPMAAMAWIGEPLQVAGQLHSAVGAQRLAVEVWLIDPGHPQQGRLLGVLPTDTDGHFAGMLGIPADADPQTYDVVVRFPGDPKRAPCDSGP